MVKYKQRVCVIKINMWLEKLEITSEIEHLFEQMFTKCQTKIKYMILSEIINIFQDQKANILNRLIKIQYEI